MIGIIVILAISWLIMRYFGKNEQSFLGLLPIQRSVLHFFSGFLLILSIQLFITWIQTTITSSNWHFQEDFSLQLILQAVGYHLNSAATEDLVFRGALLVVIIQKTSLQKASLLSGLAFGIYHWFSYNMWGAGLIPMTYVLLITGFTGYTWAIAYGKTKSIMLGLGLHFGWNIFTSLIYESQPYGELLFVQEVTVAMTATTQTLFSIFKGLFPGLIILIFLRLFYTQKAPD